MPESQTPPSQRKCVEPQRTDPRKIDYREIAWWAEAADGDRDEDLVVLELEENGNVTHVVRKKKEATQQDPDHPQRKIKTLFEIRTPSCRPDRLKVTKITIEAEDRGGNKLQIQCQGGDPKDPKRVVQCDAVFCSESAIEKFLFPYYHSQRLLNTHDWEDLNDAFRDENVAAVGHVYPSISFGLKQGTSAKDSLHILRPKPGPQGLPELEWVSLRDYGEERRLR